MFKEILKADLRGNKKAGWRQADISTDALAGCGPRADRLEGRTAGPPAPQFPFPPRVCWRGHRRLRRAGGNRRRGVPPATLPGGRGAPGLAFRPGAGARGPPELRGCWFRPDVIQSEAAVPAAPLPGQRRHSRRVPGVRRLRRPPAPSTSGPSSGAWSVAREAPPAPGTPCPARPPRRAPVSSARPRLAASRPGRRRPPARPPRRRAPCPRRPRRPGRRASPVPGRAQELLPHRCGDAAASFIAERGSARRPRSLRQPPPASSPPNSPSWLHPPHSRSLIPSSLILSHLDLPKPDPRKPDPFQT